MLAVVRMHHTRKKLFEINGRIPAGLIKYLQNKYRGDLSFINKKKDLAVDAFDSDWYKKTMATMTPGKAMKHYRENRGLTQAGLAQILQKASDRTLSSQNISDMENGRRAISKEVAKKMAIIFKTSADRFI